MGAHTFSCVGAGDTALEAFKDAQERASHYCDRDDDDEGGYEGDVRTKRNFTLIEVPSEFAASFTPRFKGETVQGAYAEKLVEDADRRVDRKDGPAGCIQIDEKNFLFFGWASA